MSRKRRHRRPRWAEVPTGPRLCASLGSVQPGAVADEQLMELLSARARQLAYQQAQVWAVMAEIGRRPALPRLAEQRPWNPVEVFDSAVEEIRAELRLTRRSARRELEHAEAVAALPAVAAALEAGVIDRARAIVLAEGCADLTAAQATALLDHVLPGAAALTATGLADKFRRTAIALDPAWAERRYRNAIRERRVIAYLNEDGSATVSGQRLPADQAAAACKRIDTLAERAKRAGANARLDHLRADRFLGLLDGRFHGLHEAAIISALVQQYPPQPASTDSSAEPRSADDAAAHDAAADDAADGESVEPVAVRGVHVRIGLAALLGLDEAPGEIAGLGVVIAPVARKVVARQRRAEWRFAVLDEHGQLLYDGLTRHRPSSPDTETGPTDAAARARGGIVELHVPAALLEDADLAAQHPAWARLLADLTKQYAQQRRPEQQRPAQDPAARFPGRPLRRHSETNFARCVFACCRRPASQCDQDHRVEHAKGGRTEAENLAPLCAHDNQLKNRGWRLLRTGPRTFTWISPLGRKHTVNIEPVAVPLPTPIPRPIEPQPVDVPEFGDPAPTFEPLTQRGRPLANKDDATSEHRTGTSEPKMDPDPPPF